MATGIDLGDMRATLTKLCVNKTCKPFYKNAAMLKHDGLSLTTSAATMKTNAIILTTPRTHPKGNPHREQCNAKLNANA